MKKVLKVIGYLLVIALVAIGALLTYVKTALPNVGQAEDLKIDYTPERIARGQYLANSVNVCMDCHSTRDWTKFSGPPTPGTLGKGGDRFDQTVGMPGVYNAKNITPHGISRYTDGELYRVITTGVTKEGKALFPIMPYPYYGRMDPEDVYSVIAYIRSLPTIASTVEDAKHDFPFNFIVNTIPQKAEPQKRPEKTDLIAYGAYMTNAAGCIECHTPVEKGQIIKELAFSGGRDFAFPDGSVLRASNISQDKETGIGAWTEDVFIQKFKQYADSTYQIPSVGPGEFNSIMPWTMYAGMERDDLAAIYVYLKTMPAMKNAVVKYTPAKKG